MNINKLEDGLFWIRVGEDWMPARAFEGIVTLLGPTRVIDPAEFVVMGPLSLPKAMV